MSPVLYAGVVITPTNDGVGVSGEGCAVGTEARLRLGVDGTGGTLKVSELFEGSLASLAALLLDLFDGRLGSACAAKGLFRSGLEAILAVPFTTCRLAVLAERLSDIVPKSADHSRRQPARMGRNRYASGRLWNNIQRILQSDFPKHISLIDKIWYKTVKYHSSAWGLVSGS